MVRSVARLLATLLRGEKSMLSKSNAVPRRPLTALIAGIVIASAVASAPSLAADTASVVAAAQKSVEKFTAGTETKPPASGPKAVAGKSIFVISCGQVIPGCSMQTNGAVEAGKALGWNVTLVDGNFGVNDAYNKGIRQAVAAHADGVILVSVDCNRVTQALREAKAAGVKVVGQNGFTCADDPSLMALENYSMATPDLAAFGQAEGAAQAAYIIAKRNGKSKILNFRFVDNTFAIQITNGFTTKMAECGDCVVKNGDIALSDYGTPTGFTQKVNASLLAAGDVDAVRVPFDSFITGGVGPAVVNAGKAANTLVIGSEGFEANLNLIRQKRGESVAFASDQAWIGWGAADALNRVFAGGQPAPAGIGFKLIDADHNMPASGDYHSAIDFKSVYKAVWGK
jgi:ribose transport system substrate-binding protein